MICIWKSQKFTEELPNNFSFNLCMQPLICVIFVLVNHRGYFIFQRPFFYMQKTQQDQSRSPLLSDASINMTQSSVDRV